MSRRRRERRPPPPDPFGPVGGCQGKRRYPSEKEAILGAFLAGVEAHRRAYPCPHCGHWHLTRRD